MGVARKLLVLAVGAGSLQSILSAGDFRRAECDGEECDVEETMFLQKTLSEHVGFPNVGDIVDQAKKAAEGLQGDALKKVNDMAGRVLVSAGGEVNKTISDYSSRCHEHAAQMRQYAKKVRMGLDSLFARAFNVSIAGVKTSPDDEKAARDMLDKSSAWFESMTASLEGTTKLADAVPSQFMNLSGTFNASLQNALERCRGAARSFADVRGLIEGKISAAADGDSSVLQQGISMRATSTSVGQVWRTVLEEEAPKSAEGGAADFVAKLNAAVEEAQAELKGFADGFGGSFDELSANLLERLKGTFGDDMMAQVREAFDGLGARAKAIAAEAQEAYGSLLSTVSDATRDTGIAPNGGLVAAAPGAASLAAAAVMAAFWAGA